MNNNLLIESIRDNPISLDERSAILIDDLFSTFCFKIVLFSRTIVSLSLFSKYPKIFVSNFCLSDFNVLILL